MIRLRGVRRSRTPTNRLALPVSAPPGLEAHTFQIDSDEYVVVAFDVVPERASPITDDLTPAELSVMSLLAQGQSNAAIARARGTSPRTIANQLTGLYRKLGVTSRRELLVRATKQTRTAT
jgi:DNA-binding NarL/FixJ family response regulator